MSTNQLRAPHTLIDPTRCLLGAQIIQTYLRVVWSKVSTDKVSSYATEDIDDSSTPPPQPLLYVPEHKETEEQYQSKMDQPVRERLVQPAHGAWYCS